MAWSGAPVSPAPPRRSSPDAGAECVRVRQQRGARLGNSSRAPVQTDRSLINRPRGATSPGIRRGAAALRCRGSSEHADRAGRRAPGQRLLDDAGGGVLRADELAVADVERHVVRAAARAAPVEDVARLEVAQGDRRARRRLILRDAREADAGLLEGGLEEAGAVPGVGAGGTQDVGVTDLRLREGDDRRGRTGGRR